MKVGMNGKLPPGNWFLRHVVSADTWDFCSKMADVAVMAFN